VPRLVERIAIQAGGEIAENGLARLVPVLGSVMGGTLNYYFVRGWGRRAQRHFRERHLLLREISGLNPAARGAKSDPVWALR